MSYFLIESDEEKTKIVKCSACETGEDKPIVSFEKLYPDNICYWTED